MKRWIGLCILSISVYVGALPLSTASKQEAEALNIFLQAAYAQRQASPQRFALLRKALEKQPDSSYIKQQLVAEALAVDVPALAEPYIDFIEKSGDDADAWSVYGAYQWTKDNVAEAVKAYEKALELEPDDERILLQYITVLATTDPQKAAQQLEEMARSHTAYAPEIYSEMGRMYLYHQNYPAALESFNKAVSLDETMTQPRLGRATVYEKTSQYFLMLHELEELEKMGYATAQTLAQIGSVYVLVKDFPRAQQYFLKAKERDNGNIAAGYFLSVLAEQQEDYVRAIGYIKDTSDYEQSPAKQIQVSYFQRKLNQPEESFKTISRAYEQFKDNHEIVYLYSVALYERGEYRKSVRLLAPLVEQLPDNQDVRLQYAYALEGQKKYNAMDAQIAVILEQNPQNAPALNLQAYSWAKRYTRLDEAAEYIARALSIWPQDNSFMDTQAWVFYKQGKYEAAADIIRAIPDEVMQANPEIAYHAVLIFGALKDKETYKRYFALACGEQNQKHCLKELGRIR